MYYRHNKTKVLFKNDVIYSIPRTYAWENFLGRGVGVNQVVGKIAVDINKLAVYSNKYHEILAEEAMKIDKKQWPDSYLQHLGKLSKIASYINEKIRIVPDEKYANNHSKSVKEVDFKLSIVDDLKKYNEEISGFYLIKENKDLHKWRI